MVAVPQRRMTSSTKVAVIVVTAVLYAIGKGLTAFIHTPWGVGQLLVGVFLPGFMAVVSDTFSVAVGAALGTFLGDALILTPLGATTPQLSLVAGVPGNFVAFLFFGWFVKRYRTWPAFVAASVSFVTLGNVIAATSVVLFTWAVRVFALPTAWVLGNPALPVQIIFGLTVFWNMTSIPAMVVGVPPLLRAVKPLYGRSSILQYEPGWPSSLAGRQTMTGIGFGVLFLAIGLAFIALDASSATTWPGLELYTAVAAAIIIVFAPIASVVAGTKLQAKPSGG
ncbi:MAG: hypothetical protein ABR867_04930 [Nitrososphaerales archaeon]